MSGLTEGVASQRDALSNLRVHASRASSNRQIAATEADELEHYANRLTRSLQSLQNQIRQSERALEQVIRIRDSRVRAQRSKLILPSCARKPLLYL